MEIIAVIWSILCIILFFKVWKACNAIMRLANKYAPEKQDKPHRSSTPETKEDVEKWLNGEK